MKAFLFSSELAYQNFGKAAIAKTFISFILFISSFIIYVIRIYHYYHKRKPLALRLPPGPKPWPLLGCLPAMLLRKKNSPTHQWIHEVMKQFNNEIACIRLGSNTHIIPVASPELALEFLKTYDSVFASRPIISITAQMLSYGFLGTVVLPIGDQWKKMRKNLASHVFNPSTLHRILGQRLKKADTLLCYVFSLTRSCEAINIRSITQHYCNNIIRRMIFNRRYYGKGREDEGPSFEEEYHNQALLTILMHTYAFSVSEFMPCLKPFDLDGHRKIVKGALNVIRNYDEPIIEESVQEWRDGRRNEVEDILDILISLKNENGTSMLSIEEISAQITVGITIFSSIVEDFTLEI
ncbi:tryptophan N-monooxygenase CYP79A68-like [Benincasa hispida]|uniref:tryptophan N-monooxygenase CYP79A68-like n=1 Tax=Benincasa hispida TaxID=102211 RepID=UPI0019020FB8|nr:tryptophan N-monooxygenase CYP79A68-like [Benincasa hispida]